MKSRQEVVRQQPHRKELGEHSQGLINYAVAIKKLLKKSKPHSGTVRAKSKIALGDLNWGKVLDGIPSLIWDTAK